MGTKVIQTIFFYFSKLVHKIISPLVQLPSFYSKFIQFETIPQKHWATCKLWEQLSKFDSLNSEMNAKDRERLSAFFMAVESFFQILFCQVYDIEQEKQLREWNAMAMG